VTSGIRLGTPAATTRGFGGAEFKQVGAFIGRVLGGLASHPESNEKNEQEVRAEVKALCRRFPIYPDMGI
jgi:glycine hydroxymethyltransferase